MNAATCGRWLASWRSCEEQATATLGRAAGVVMRTMIMTTLAIGSSASRCSCCTSRSSPSETVPWLPTTSKGYDQFRMFLPRVIRPTTDQTAVGTNRRPATGRPAQVTNGCASPNPTTCYSLPRRQDSDEVRGAHAVDTNPTKGRYISGVLRCDGVLSHLASLCDNGIGLRSGGGRRSRRWVQANSSGSRSAAHAEHRRSASRGGGVGVAGLEATTSSSRMKCASKAFGGKAFGGNGPCCLTENQQRGRPYAIDPDAALNAATCMTQPAEPLRAAVAL